jgi:hypothetical protein
MSGASGIGAAVGGDITDIIVMRFDRVDRPGVLRGHATLHLPRLRLTLFGCPVFVSDAGKWVGLPSKPMLDRDGNVRRDGAGKPTFVPMLAWDSRTLQASFSRSAIAALDHFDPSWREGGR